MLIRFQVENWASFRDKVELSMAASRERQHRERIPKIKKLDLSILPIAAVYGGNAAGKTNLFRALAFARAFVVNGTKIDGMIGVEPFRLNNQSPKQPTRFEFDILAGGCVYEYSFAITPNAVIEEKLVRLSNKKETVLFDRSMERYADNEVKGYQIDLSDDFLKYAARGTRANMLFLTNTVSQNGRQFEAVYNWFARNLELIAPDSRFEPFDQFIDENSKLYSVMNSLLPQLDTGIQRICGDEVAVENVPLLDGLKLILTTNVKDGETVCVRTSLSDRYVFKRQDGIISAKKLITYHFGENGEPYRFEMRQESDGSLRVIDLLPAFLKLMEHGSEKVFVIDELDRSLHTVLTRALLDMYLGCCSPDTRAQLLITSHDAMLFDQNIFRRDEIWITERNRIGVSSLYSLCEYKDVRYDKDVRRSYLQGRFGGIPRVILLDSVHAAPAEVFVSDAKGACDEA